MTHPGSKGTPAERALIAFEPNVEARVPRAAPMSSLRVSTRTGDAPRMSARVSAVSR